MKHSRKSAVIRRLEKLVKSLRKEIRVDSKTLKDEDVYTRKHLDKIWEHISLTNQRLQDIEIQLALVSRLLTALAVEKMNVRTFSLIKMIRKIEKELIRDHQIQHLEDLYKLDHPKGKRGSSN